ncbi:RluA family pseudouridine synthase [Brevibacillus fluminis]|uniref:Pseudouridine synthase n=1 Tax=Brevibacillus fluminis TaxID=511487 RepID=A0A3M8DI97_9BACL|nr:RluA family pseudouridine synthase [Brevibacillus fluminis]RNB87823.1 RluA family pseudouridine synthase [Brevibacillus fluminis]
MEKVLSFTACERQQGKTVRDVLQQEYGVSRRLLIRAKHEGRILVNGSDVYVNHVLKADDEVIVMIQEETAETIEPQAMPIEVRFEDEDLLIVAKPAGLVVHPTRTHEDGTLANGVIAYWLANGEERKFRPVNRLDKDTSGLMIIAKNQWAHEQCSRMQKDRTILRTYVAAVHGMVEQEEGTIDAPIGLADHSIIERTVRADGQPARTHYRVLKREDGYTWVELRLDTGRTHQIRVHMRYLGHPLVGDDLYGGKRELIDRQALHAWRLEFAHPRSKELLCFEEPLPNDMRLLEK